MRCEISLVFFSWLDNNYSFLTNIAVLWPRVEYWMDKDKYTWFSNKIRIQDMQHLKKSSLDEVALWMCAWGEHGAYWCENNIFYLTSFFKVA